MTAEAFHQRHMAVVLALAVLSTACSLPEVASSAELEEATPLLLKVAAAGGAATVLLQRVSSRNWLVLPDLA